MPSNNNRLDDPTISDDYYLIQTQTHPDGSSETRVLQPGKESLTTAQISSADAGSVYNVTQHNENADVTVITQGHLKTAANSQTSTVINGTDEVSDHLYKKLDNGIMLENAGGNHQAHDGDNIEATSQNKKTFATGGHGVHGVEGDQSIITNSGRIDFQASQGLGILTEQGVTISSGQDTYMVSGTNFAIRSIANTSIDATGSAYMSSDNQLNFSGRTDVTLACGSPATGGALEATSALTAPASIIMTPGKITFKVGTSVIDITPASITINSPAINIGQAAGIVQISGTPIKLN